jgi:integrase
MAGQYLTQRGGVWWFKRRVPRDISELDPRGVVRWSTKKRDYADAVVVAARVNAELEALWLALAEGPSPARSAAAERFQAAAKLARTLGVAYRPAADLAGGPLDEVVRRIELLEAKGLDASVPAAEAVLGGVPRPALRLSELFAVYEEHARDRLLGKSDDQVRKWRNPRMRAVRNALAVIGDKALPDITREDALEFRSWWLDRVTEEGMDPGTPNKDLGHLASMIGALDEAWRLGLDNPFRGLRLAGERHNPRTPYAADFVRIEILPGHRLMRLNAEARGIVLMVAATGMRPSEVATLTRDRIVIEADIPHVAVRGDGRQLKSRAAEREMPLCGVALEVMREHRDGFPRYREVPDAFSAVANKGLSEAGLRPTQAHTVYSLRHTFKDRLIALEAPPRVQDALMGHAVGEIEYGAGPSLAQRSDWMARVWG